VFLVPRPLLTIACSLAGGIALFVITGSALPVFLVAAGLAVVLLLWPGLRDRRLSVILVVVPLLLGPFVATLRTPVAPGALPASVHIEGQISQVDAYDEYTRVRVSVTAWQGKKIPALARPLVDIWVQGKPPQGTVRYALVDWRGDLSAPEGPTNPGEFNFAAYLARLGVVAQSDGPGKLQVLRPAQGLTPLVASTLEQIRAS
jgi:predicted membrane metal-binding protein